MNRRQFLGLGAAAGAASLAGCTLEQSTESGRENGPEIGLETVISGLTAPTGMVFLPNGDRLVIERSGQIRRHRDGGLTEEPFFDVSGRMAEVNAEKGLIGIALHPEFADNRKLYIRYSGQLTASLSEAAYSHVEVLSELTLTSDFTGVVPDSERRVLEVPQPGGVHNAGDIAFGPDGYLYVPLGDGQRTDLGTEGWSWWYEQGQSAQNTRSNLLGGILRIDVDSTEEGYGIPPDNPLVGETGRDEYYAWGLRNPYRISFDGDRLFIGNVGEQTRESVFLGEKGANYGWPILEGSSCAPTTSVGHSLAENPLNAFNPKTWQALNNRISPVKVCSTPQNSDGSFTNPIIEYRRPGSRSVTGGYVYRGDEVPALQGKYIFGDFIPPAPIFATEEPEEGGKPWDMTELRVGESGRLSVAILSFARDPQGAVYVLTTQFSEGGGEVRRIVPPN